MGVLQSCPGQLLRRCSQTLSSHPQRTCCSPTLGCIPGSQPLRGAPSTPLPRALVLHCSVGTPLVSCPKGLRRQASAEDKSPPVSRDTFRYNWKTAEGGWAVEGGGEARASPCGWAGAQGCWVRADSSVLSTFPAFPDPRRPWSNWPLGSPLPSGLG